MSIETELTGEVLIARWPDKNHSRLTNCPRCGDDCLRVAITRLAYIHVSCDCHYASYPHLIEQLWHTACLIEDAPKVVERDLLEDALFTVGHYRRGQSLAARIRAYLGEVAP